jgi:holliday junction DNA helicase RuvB
MNMPNANLNAGAQSLSASDRDFENNIRPSVISEFTGQDQIIDNLKVFIKAAKMRNEALDHVLFHGPPGLGKTTLSRD